jgi:hypothetical protein
MTERNYIVIKTHVTTDLTQDEAYMLATRLRSMGYGSEIITHDEWREQNRGTMQDLTPFLTPELRKQRFGIGASE